MSGSVVSSRSRMSDQTALHTPAFQIALGSLPALLHANASSPHGWFGVEKYRLEGFWCINLFRGPGVVRLNRKPYRIAPGFVGITGPEMDIEYQYEGLIHLTWVHFKPVGAARPVEVPVMSDAGLRFPEMVSLAERVADYQQTDNLRARVALWELLWLIAVNQPSRPVNKLPRHVSAAMTIISSGLPRGIRASEVVDALGVSQSHLNGLFVEATGKTLGRYIRDGRAERAHMLLTLSEMSIKEIALHVGIPDLSSFNRMIHDAWGQSPRELRNKGNYWPVGKPAVPYRPLP